tara:strand:- start:213 stop:650 length:438 start_codon:yes stop_codon:yes gene_type:complete
MKNEPDDYSIDNLKKDKICDWYGIRNYQVRNMIRDEMKKNDLAFFYHSNCDEPGIYGLMKIYKESYPDHTAFDRKAKYYDPKSNRDEPRWFMVDVKYIRHLKRPISLNELKSHKKLNKMKVVQRGNRLSITKLSQNEWNFILKIE